MRHDVPPACWPVGTQPRLLSLPSASVMIHRDIQLDDVALKP
jgi:hypothetical protein